MGVIISKDEKTVVPVAQESDELVKPLMLLRHELMLKFNLKQTPKKM